MCYMPPKKVRAFLYRLQKLAEGFSSPEKFEGFYPEGFSPQSFSSEGFSPGPHILIENYIHCT